MRQSQLFTKTLKDAPKDEESTNAKLLIRAGFVHKEMAGVYSFLPLGLRVLKNIENVIREEMDKVGGQEMFMPALQSKENWKQTGRWDSLDNLFRFTSYYTKQDYALGATHEEIVVPLAKTFISSYRDLPQYVYQIQNKFRDEKRAKSGILRGREFLMKDLYSFHVDQKDLDAYYEVVKDAYRRIFEKVGIGGVTYLTFASGGTFAKYSHEFQTVTLAGEDTIYLCEKCDVAVNEEIIKDQPVCPECKNKNLRREKAVEVGNIFKLGTKYSEPFHLSYKDEKGKENLVVMGCYGIGLNRLMGVIAEVFHDEKGILWPKAVAPALVHLVSLEGGEQKAEELYKDLQEKGIEVLYDDRQDASAGEKFTDADLMGIPLRVVVSKKTIAEKKVEVKKRNEKQERLILEKEIIEYIRAI
ncbi:MAG: prolyl-tRNA synthetase [Candidatus Wildermuthbacteria bacterium]|nr:prolyl-tRNA synthetase [Candidatus Wildermuthbacteria bacterium]